MNRARKILIGVMVFVSINLIASAEKNETMNSNNTDTITLGAGCFWCIEAIFQELKGVEQVISGYSGGKVKNPSYRAVCSGETGHAEVCQLVYNPDEVSLTALLEVFWQIHDPTTLNRQGADVGTQYRSVIFYHNEEQGQLAANLKRKLNNEKVWRNPVVTEISPMEVFYAAEDYHQEYYLENSNENYCRLVITPKVEKFRKVFSDKLK